MFLNTLALQLKVKLRHQGLSQMSKINPPPVQIHKREGKWEDVDGKCEGRNGGAPCCADNSLGGGIVPSGQVSGQEAIEDMKGNVTIQKASLGSFL